MTRTTQTAMVVDDDEEGANVVSSTDFVTSSGVVSSGDGGGGGGGVANGSGGGESLLSPSSSSSSSSPPSSGRLSRRLFHGGADADGVREDGDGDAGGYNTSGHSATVHDESYSSAPPPNDGCDDGEGAVGMENGGGDSGDAVVGTEQFEAPPAEQLQSIDGVGTTPSRQMTRVSSIACASPSPVTSSPPSITRKTSTSVSGPGGGGGAFPSRSECKNLASASSSPIVSATKRTTAVAEASTLTACTLTSSSPGGLYERSIKSMMEKERRRLEAVEFEEALASSPGRTILATSRVKSGDGEEKSSSLPAWERLYQKGKMQQQEQLQRSGGGGGVTEEKNLETCTPMTRRVVSSHGSAAGGAIGGISTVPSSSSSVSEKKSDDDEAAAARRQRDVPAWERLYRQGTHARRSASERDLSGPSSLSARGRRRQRVNHYRDDEVKQDKQDAVSDIASVSSRASRSSRAATVAGTVPAWERLYRQGTHARRVATERGSGRRQSGSAWDDGASVSTLGSRTSRASRACASVGSASVKRRGRGVRQQQQQQRPAWERLYEQGKKGGVGGGVTASDDAGDSPGITTMEISYVTEQQHHHESLVSSSHSRDRSSVSTSTTTTTAATTTANEEQSSSPSLQQQPPVWERLYEHGRRHAPQDATASARRKRRGFKNAYVSETNPLLSKVRHEGTGRHRLDGGGGSSGGGQFEGAALAACSCLSTPVSLPEGDSIRKECTNLEKDGEISTDTVDEAVAPLHSVPESWESPQSKER